jgi:signal transduction histidine kinase
MRTPQDQSPAARVSLESESLPHSSERRIAELQEAVLARDEFLTIAAHELRNPMGAMVLAVQALRIATERASPNPPANLHDKLRSLERRIDHYVGRATMLLDVTRLTSGRFQLELEAVDLSVLVHEVVEEFADDLARADCQLELDLEDGVTGHWDRGALDQVLTNLISNALKYGSGRPVAVRLSADQDDAVLEIRDQGIGISADDQARIFHKFERAVKRRQHGGFGIGLWITRQIVEGLQGTIAVSSAPGEGSTFRVTLPRRQSLQGDP